MSSSIQVVTAPTADTPGTTLVLQTQKRHYVFGSHAEGTQRAMNQAGIRMTKVQDFFMTGRMEWSNTGGLIGMALTLADSAAASYEQSMELWRKGKGTKKAGEPQKPNLNIYGPPNLKHALGTCRRYIFRKGIPTNATEYKDVPPTRNEQGNILPTWQDANIQVWALPVSPPRKDLDAHKEDTLTARRAFYEKFANHFEEHQAPDNETPEDREMRYDRIRTAVLDFMYNSNWNFDTLIERHISEVEMPTAMFVRNPRTHRLEPYSGPHPGGKEPLPDIKVLTRTPWPGAKVVALPPTKPAPESISYIVRTHSARGAFDVKRAKELGIKQGPLFGRLSNGVSVQNEKGETITPDMVMGPDRPGQGFAVLDVPSEEYLKSLFQREELQSESVMKGIGACFWLLGPGLSGHPMLQQFMQKLDKVQHVISSVDDCPNRLALDSVAAQTTRLGQIDPVRYHIPFHDNTTLPQNSLYGLGSSERKISLSNAIVADRGVTFSLMPKFERKDKTVRLVDLDEIKKAMDPEIIEFARAAQQDVAQDQESLQAWRQLLARPDTEVITLGTGSALPSKYRNVSATLLRVPGIGNYLFDCGENTIGQLQRVFKPDELVEIIKNLKVIWISHLHADHHLGTASMIRTWYKIVHNGVPAEDRPEPATLAADISTYGLSVISHQGMIQWLREYSSVEDFGYSRILPLEIYPVESGADSGSALTLTIGSNPQDQNAYVIKKEDYEAILGLADIQACKVAHCYGAMAVSLTFPRSPSDQENVKPLKVSYSGDCRPSKNFTNIGRNSTVLIHEATFDDELQGDAIAKKHSTTSEALGIGAQMGAKAVVLTHFSQRYQKIPVLQTVQDGEQEDELLDPEAMEDVQPDEDADDAPADNMDVHPSTTTGTDKTSALHSNRAHPPPTLHHHQSSTHEHERIIKVRSRDMKVAIAFDYMRVKIGEIAQLEKFNDALNRLLIKEEEEGDGNGDGASMINANGKKASGDEGGGKKKKSKRNN
ncbi:ribonuclease Z mitochondrial precursor [Trematosphaeria pertusa]|uniref:ribonuclease Z n=1 Tax=Trematosphaeria pertusa TaxID=390896 RepID=A0A6A6IC84_9PLEO|nr:ribonuclease Z mitochondrial precursor [Trematosphaeria pertusa]KAF2247160.1 ribonuclease Z mitochondrial precursor [Trematosphaeria pertusa]